MIGIFDSGIGGLSVFREIRRLMPDEDYVYFSDSAHCPYGGKTRDYIIERCRYIVSMLLEKGCDTIVIACNTASSAAAATLREEYADIPVIAMEPAVKPAAESTESGIIGILATAGTLKGEKYLKMKQRFSDRVKILEHVGEGFVELVEAGEFTGSHAEEVVGASLKPLLDAGADVIALGCTHYPFLMETIRRIAGDGVRIIDPAPAVARHLKEVMDENAKRKAGSPKGSGHIELLSSGSTEELERMFSRLLNGTGDTSLKEL